jgi:outer membrane protein assembly factor BamB
MGDKRRYKMVSLKFQKSLTLAVVMVSVLMISSNLILPSLTYENSIPEIKEPTVSPSIPQQRATRAGTSWPMMLNNPLHTSFTTDSGPATNDVLWFNSTGGVTYSSPTVAAGMVFIGSRASSSSYDYMNAYYENNGTLAWRMETYDSTTGGFGVASTPAYSDGFVYFGADEIYCLYANNGTVKWSVSHSGGQDADDSTANVVNGKVFISASDRKLYCLDQYTGSIIWTFQTLSGGPDNWGLYGTPAVAGGSVYLAAGDGYVYQINETQPTSVATANNSFNMAYASYDSVVYANGMVFVGCGYLDPNPVNRFYALDAADLSLIWEFYPGVQTSFFSSAGFYNGRVYIGSIDGNLYCLDSDGFEDGNDGWTGESLTSLGDGDVIWSYNMGPTWSSPAITQDRLYIGSKGGYTYCFNLSQTPGSENYLWRFLHAGDVDSSPAVTDGRVYSCTRGLGGMLYIFGTLVTPPAENYTVLKEGWNLISVPWVQSDGSLTSVLDSLSGKYNAVQRYETWDMNKKWKHYRIGKSFGNDLAELNETMGFWIYVTQPGDTNFVYNGTQPSVNQTIQLYQGWNQVGYPSLTSYNRTVGLNNLTFGTHVDAIQWFNATTKTWHFVNQDDYFVPGRGYWFHSLVEMEWEVPL